MKHIYDNIHPQVRSLAFPGKDFKGIEELMAELEKQDALQTSLDRRG